MLEVYILPKQTDQQAESSLRGGHKYRLELKLVRSFFGNITSLAAVRFPGQNKDYLVIKFGIKESLYLQILVTFFWRRKIINS